MSTRRLLWVVTTILVILLPFRFSSASYSDSYLISKPYNAWSKDEIVIYILDKSEEYGLDPYLIFKIVNAESGFNYLAHNKVGTASGLFQFLDSTFKRLCISRYNLTESLNDKNDIVIQTDCALSTILDGGIGNWDESKKIWSR